MSDRYEDALHANARRQVGVCVQTIDDALTEIRRMLEQEKDTYRLVDGAISRIGNAMANGLSSLSTSVSYLGDAAKVAKIEATSTQEKS